MQKIITRIPLDYADLRQFYLDGTNSIMKNLPRPSVTLHEKHSYVLHKCALLVTWQGVICHQQFQQQK